MAAALVHQCSIYGSRALAAGKVATVLQTRPYRAWSAALPRTAPTAAALVHQCSFCGSCALAAQTLCERHLVVYGRHAESRYAVSVHYTDP
jgi:hypothetical protein